MKWILLLTFLISFSCWSAGQVKITVPSINEVTVGDVLAAELVLWPKEELTENDLKSLESTFLGKNSIYIGSVGNIEKSPNNEQALVAHLVLVPMAAGSWAEIKTITIKGQSYPLQLTSIQAQAFEKISDKFLSLEQELPSSQSWKWIAGGGGLGSLVALLLFLPFFKRKRREKAIAREEELKKKKWEESLRGAQSRADYENLYAHRSEWVKGKWLGDSNVIKFFETLHTHQYKKDWSQDVKGEIDSIFAKIRGKLDE